MANWIYCATNAQVDAEHTANLLRAEEAIWCPPEPVLPLPQAGDRVWLIWRHDSRGGQTFLLGGGLLLSRPVATQANDVYWTDADRGTLLQASHDEGYDRGATDTAFLVLDLAGPVPNPPFPTVTGIGRLDSGLNPATPTQVAALQALLSIP